jgi:hypothetical protein
VFIKVDDAFGDRKIVGGGDLVKKLENELKDL